MNTAKIVFLSLLMPLTTCVAIAAMHDDIPGSDTPVHYVRLSGYGGNNELNLKLLADTHQSCVTNKRAANLPYRIVSAQDTPRFVWFNEKIEIYYAANRTLTVSHGVLHTINLQDCSLQATPGHSITIVSSVGTCSINMDKNTASGACDAAALAKAPYRVPSLPGPLSVSTGETKVIANTRCEVRRASSAGLEICIANPESGQGFVPYPIPAGPYNSGLPGVVLETTSIISTLTAQEVRWNMAVSDRLFSVPAGVRVRPGYLLPP